ncbi:hypothetical protein ACMFMG_008184 [Clarireedia jacksonii]
MARAISTSTSHTPLGLLLPNLTTEAIQTASENIIATPSSIKTTTAKIKRYSATAPELQHPRPQRRTHHEILVDGYGNGINYALSKTMSGTLVNEVEVAPRKQSSDPITSSHDASLKWSNSSYEAEGTNFDSIEADSPRTSRSFRADSPHGSISSVHSGEGSIEEIIPRPESAYSVSIYDEDLEQETILMKSSISTTDFANTNMAPSPLFSRHH